MKSLIFFFLTAAIVTGSGILTVSAATDNFLSRLTINAEKPGDDDIDQLIESALALLQQKKYDEALSKCARAAELYPKDYRAHSVTGLVYLAQEKFKDASEEFAKSISLQPDNIRTYLLKADADRLRGEKDQAVAEYRQVLKMAPDRAEAYAAIGKILILDEKSRDEALAAYRSAIRIDPHYSLDYEYLANIFLLAKDEKGAEDVYRKQIVLDPKLMTRRFALGRLLVKQMRLKEARELWEGRTSDNDQTFPHFINLLERAEKLKQATDLLAQKPGDPEILLQMGFAVMDGESWVADRRQDRAIEYFRKALDIKPDFAMAQYGICQAYVQLAHTFSNQDKILDQELSKLKDLDPKLALKMEEYRKTYVASIMKLGPPPPAANTNH